MSTRVWAWVVAGLALGVLSWLGCTAHETPEELAAREEMRAAVVKLERRVSDLQAELETLKNQRSTDLRAAVQDVLRAELDTMIETTILARVEARLGEKAGVDQLVRDTVKETLAAYERQKEAEEAAAREQRRQEWEQRRAQFEEERWTRLAQDLKLTEAQKEQMRAANQSIREAIEAIWAQLRESNERPDTNMIRQRAVELKAQYEAMLSQILTPEQLAAYREQRPFNLLRMLDAIASGEGPGFFFRGDRDRGGEGRGGPPRRGN